MQALQIEKQDACRKRSRKRARVTSYRIRLTSDGAYVAGCSQTALQRCRMITLKASPGSGLFKKEEGWDDLRFTRLELRL